MRRPSQVHKSGRVCPFRKPTPPQRHSCLRRRLRSRSRPPVHRSENTGNCRLESSVACAFAESPTLELELPPETSVSLSGSPQSSDDILRISHFPHKGCAPVLPS